MYLGINRKTQSAETSIDEKLVGIVLTAFQTKIIFWTQLRRLNQPDKIKYREDKWKISE